MSSGKMGLCVSAKGTPTPSGEERDTWYPVTYFDTQLVKMAVPNVTARAFSGTVPLQTSWLVSSLTQQLMIQTLTYKSKDFLSEQK